MDSGVTLYPRSTGRQGAVSLELGPFIPLPTAQNSHKPDCLTAYFGIWL